MQALGAPLAFIGKRAAQAVLVMLAIAVIAFAVKGALGDPLREIMGEAVPEAERAELRHQLGLDAPWPVQLARYLGHVAQGDLGQSYIYKRRTLEVVLAKFPASFELMLAASLIVLLISLPAGIYCAVKPQSLGARLILALSVLGISVPVFLTGIILISIFSVRLGLAPGLRARRDGADRFLGDWAAHPRRVQAPIMCARRGPKASSRVRVWLHHALRNALLPLVALGGLQIGNMLAFTLLTETVFQWPGMGFLFLEAVTRADVPLITTYLVAVGFLFVVTNTLADVVSLWLDPRISLEGRR